MRKLFLCCFILGLFLASGCATTSEFLMPNADLIDASIDKAAIQLNNLGMEKGKTISVAELVSKSTDNTMPSALVYDALVEMLRKQGHSVVDRDRDSIRYIAPEIGQDAFPVTTRYLDMGIDKPAAWDAQVGIEGAKVKKISDNGIVIIEKSGDSEQPRVIARLPRSDYILFYRIIETGIRYGKDINTKAGNIKRVARVVLNYRLIHSESAMVMQAATVDVQVDDQIPRSMKEVLSKNLYVYYPHNHPDVLVSSENAAKRELYEGVSSNDKSPEGGRDSFYGFAVGAYSLKDDDTKDLAGNPYEATFEMFHTVANNVHILSGIGYGMGKGSVDGVDTDLWFVPIKISGVYGFDLGSFRPYVGAGLFADYTNWETKTDFGDFKGEAYLYGLQLHAGFKVSVFTMNLRYLMASNSSINGDYKDMDNADVSFDGVHINLGCLF